MVSGLNAMNCGITVAGSNFNVHCYADDLLLVSTTPAGLQTLINYANEYITSHGLKFNPAKSTCMAFGKRQFTQQPSWTIDGAPIQFTDSGMTYLGAQVLTDGGTLHTEKRASAAQKAFYGLQGSGLHVNGVAPAVATKIFNVGVRSVLTYGCHSIHLTRRSMHRLESAQGKLVKAFLGLRKFSRTSPLLEALGINTIQETVGSSCMKLLRSCITFASNAKNFYSYLLCQPLTSSSNTLVNRAMNFARESDIDFNLFLFNDSYFNAYKKRKNAYDSDNGLIDSIRTLLTDYSMNSRAILQLLVNPF